MILVHGRIFTYLSKLYRTRHNYRKKQQVPVPFKFNVVTELLYRPYLVNKHLSECSCEANGFNKLT